jgi:hypothetical protein
MTPPLSPRQSEVGDDNTIDIDTEPRFSNCCIHATPSASSDGQPVHRRESVAMQVEPTHVVPPRPPTRLLEDEKVHVEKSGTKLTDFEVKGTLGAQRSLVKFH